MAENDNQNQDPQDQSEGYEDTGSDQSTRAARTDSTPSSEQQNQGTRRQDQGADLDEADDSDEDRDDDERSDGGANRRNSIG